MGLRTVSFAHSEKGPKILSDISFELYPRETLSIVARSGVGKTTLLRLMAGLTQPSSGTVYCDLRKVPDCTPLRILVPQSDSLWPWLTVLQNVSIPLRSAGQSKSASNRISLEWLDLVELSGCERMRPTELSRGMSQRVALARACALNPAVLLLDEPFAAVDWATRKAIHDRVRPRLGGALAFSTHDVDEAIQFADRVLVLGGLPAKVHELMSTTRGEAEVRTQIMEVLKRSTH